MEFLKKIRAYAADYETGKEGLTVAGLMMFGNYDSITNVAADPSFFVDYRERTGVTDTATRWTHRIYPDGLWEANLYQFYVRVYNRMIQTLPRPFIIKEGVRMEESPAHDALREALVLTLSLKKTTPQVTPQVAPQVTPQVGVEVSLRGNKMNQLLDYCVTPRSLAEIMRFFGLKDKRNFRKNYINPLLELGKLTMTDPDNPTSSIQQYVTISK